MRGLPPPPVDTIAWELTWEIADEPSASNTFYMHSPGASLADLDQLQSVLGDLLLDPLNDLLAVTPSAASPGVSRLTSYGVTNSEVFAGSPGVFGALGGLHPLNSALVLTWAHEFGGRGSRSHTYLPLAGEMLSADGRRLNTDEWSNAVAAANAFLGHVNAITTPWVQPLELVVVSRKQHGRPLPVAQFSPVVFSGASVFAGTMRRRIGDRSQESSWA